MLNSFLSILPSFSTLDTLVLNKANADVMMLVNFVTFASFFLYFLKRSTVATPLTLTTSRDIAPREILAGRLINILSVTTLDIPEATLKQLEQTLSHFSQRQALKYFSCFCLYLSLSLGSSCHFSSATIRW